MGDRKPPTRSAETQQTQGTSDNSLGEVKVQTVPVNNSSAFVPIATESELGIAYFHSSHPERHRSLARTPLVAFRGHSPNLPQSSSGCLQGAPQTGQA
ncbi:hypothetical protein MRX96_045892 [Rhipicephalus microplus]